MQKKLLIYIFVIFVISIIFLSGYYLFVFFKEKENVSQNEFIDTEMQEIEALVPRKNIKFLVNNVIVSINDNNAIVEISALINMDINFEYSPVPWLARTFLVTENTTFFISEPGGKNQDILSGGVSRLEKGDLVAVETENSIEDILNQETFFIIKLWKIIK